jgi:hypothetical protein
MWGLSNGIFVGALAGAFWFSMAAWSAGWLPAELPIPIVAAVLAYGAVRVRREATGFRLRELKTAADTEQARARRIQIGFRWLSLLEGGLVGLSFFLCSHFHREDLMWPGMALAVSLHFLALGYLLHMRPYYATAVSGSLVAVVSLVIPHAALSPEMRTALACTGMGAAIWITTAYNLLRADRLAGMWIVQTGGVCHDARELAR